MDRMREELEKLLSVRQFALADKKLYVWGTGNTAALYAEGLRRLENEGAVIEGYCSNDSSKWGGVCNDKKVVSPAELSTMSDIYVLICSPQPQVVAAVSEQLERMHLDYAHIDEWIFVTHKEQILTVYDLLDDEVSKAVYQEIIRCRTKGEYPKPEVVNTDQYYALPEFARSDPKEVFVDCGAFAGDTIEKYVWERGGVFAGIIGFEPDPDNYEAMGKRISRLKEEWNIGSDSIRLYPYGVGEKNAYSEMERYGDNNGLGSKLRSKPEGVLASGQDGCRVVALDDFLDEPVSFIKADIESYEYKMLLGARKTILRDKPLMAVCIYHNGVDLYSIPLLLHSISPEYHMAVRHHSYAGYDTVLYAWTEC